ncbi:hypothetical protein GA0061105_101496 [Rhizobium aethiopicum]|uniref:Uncharacterized protein n=1 Tax=Rhizobium aethiopicum TaxID=1138170 RepID=A0A1C3XWP7_9HYPH|nr:hypothetical protein GA0061105_101496 [Rhizobium aethiopicum]
MAADRCSFDWTKALPAVLVAIALLFVPASGVQAMRCHDRSVEEQFERSPLHNHAHVSSQSDFETPDHKACCSGPCGSCTAAVLMDLLEVPAAQVSFLPFAGNQTGSGLASAPTLGPPRLTA